MIPLQTKINAMYHGEAEWNVEKCKKEEMEGEESSADETEKLVE